MTPVPPVVVTPSVLRAWPLPPPGQDKHDRGTVLVLGGAARSPGAAMLAGLAALRAGAGRLQLAVADTVAPAMACAVPEALVAGIAAEPVTGSIEPFAVTDVSDLLERADVVCIGPGLDDPERTATLLCEVIGMCAPDAKVVLDAVALVALAQVPDALPPEDGRAVVLTPNTGEAAALLGLAGRPSDADEIAAAATDVCQAYAAVTTLHGHTVAPDGRAWTDGSGHVGLATSGSGDVLAGLVAGLLARGADPAQAAVWGTHVHSTAGERLAARVGPLGFLARELLDEVPSVMAELAL